DPALLYLPWPAMAGAFSVHGSDEGDACGGERAAGPLHCPGIDSELFGNDAAPRAAGASRIRFSSGNYVARTVKGAQPMKFKLAINGRARGEPRTSGSTEYPPARTEAYEKCQ